MLRVVLFYAKSNHLRDAVHGNELLGHYAKSILAKRGKYGDHTNYGDMLLGHTSKMELSHRAKYGDVSDLLGDHGPVSL